VIAAAVLLAIPTVVFGIWTATSSWSFLHFLVAVVFLVYAPGRLLVDTARVRRGFLEDSTLALVLGTIAGSLVYALALAASRPRLFFAWPLVTAAVQCWRLSGAWPRATWRRLEWSDSWPFGIVALGLVPVLVLPIYTRNLAVRPDGTMSYLPSVDVLLHVSVANELTHSFPPEVPFFAGWPLSYHFAMDLVTAMFSYGAGLSTLDLAARFIPTLFLVMTILAVYVFGRLWLGSPAWAAFTAFLVVLGEDLSFVPGLILRSRADWSAQFFSVPSVYSLYYLNPMLPALGILFTACFCLARYCEAQRVTWLFVAACLFATLVEWKVFTAAHVLISLAVGGVVDFVFARRTVLLRTAALTGGLALPLALSLWLLNTRGARISVQLQPWPFIPEALQQIGLPSVGRQVDALFTGGETRIGILALVVALFLPAYLLGSLGLRVLAAPVIFQDLRVPRSVTPVRVFVGVFCLVGLGIALACTVVPEGRAPGQAYNNGVWFFAQTKYVAWIPAVEWLKGAWRGTLPVRKMLYLSLVVGLSVPSTVQHFGRVMALTLEALEAEELGVIRFVRENARPGDVVLSSERMANPLVTMTRCRVPVIEERLMPYLVPMGELRRRLADRSDFWTAWQAGQLRGDVLGRYNVRYVVTEHDPVSGTFLPAVRGPGRRFVPGSPSLELGFANARFAVYKVRE
jgi:hypothetical protein